MAVKKIENKDLMDCAGKNVDFLQCNIPKPMSDFYDSWSPYNITNIKKLNRKTNKQEFVHKTKFCKVCLGQIYSRYKEETGSSEFALFLTCMQANIPFIAEKVESTFAYVTSEAKRGAKVSNIFGTYYNILARETSKHHLWQDFSCTDIDYKDIATHIEHYEVAKQDVENLELTWGKQEPKDYAILTETFMQDTKGIEFENPTQEYLYRQLSLAKLRKRKMLDSVLGTNKEVDQQEVGRINTEIFQIMDKLKVADFDSNKPKTFADKTMFNKLLMIDEQNVKDVYKEPTKHFDHNEFIKYQRESTLRPMASMLIGNSDFGLTIEDIEEYNLE